MEEVLLPPPRHPTTHALTTPPHQLLNYSRIGLIWSTCISFVLTESCLETSDCGALRTFKLILKTLEAGG